MTKKRREEEKSPKDSIQEENIEEEKVWELPDVEETEESGIGNFTNETIENQKKELSELNDKYLRLYSEFENYKRRVTREKEELIKYSNEELLEKLLSVIDHLELALQHSVNSTGSNISALIEGVEMTLKELRNTLEKFGLAAIESIGKTFDPFVHHAMTQVETEETEENTVVIEFRKGYMLNDKVIRPAYVGVSKRKVNSDSVSD